MSGRDDGQPFAARAEIETDRIPLQSGRGRYGDPRKELPPFLQPPPRQERFPEGQRVRGERALSAVLTEKETHSTDPPVAGKGRHS